MTSSLPRYPNTEILKKQAKMLLAAHRRGAPGCGPLFRRIRRYSASSDEELFQLPTTLADAQLALALHYGHASWKEMMEEARSHPRGRKFSLEAALDGSEEPLPDYAGAGVPLAVVAAMNHAGVPVRFMEFAAASGWAFSFGYLYHDIAPAFMGVRGNPEEDGPFEVFSFLPSCHGLGYEMALTSDHEGLWRFVRERVDAGTPVMSEHMDGGLIAGYREKDGSRQIFLDGTVSVGWIPVGGLQPYAVYAFVREGEAWPPGEVTRAALGRALSKGRGHEWRGVPQGLSALRSYLADVSDPTKDFEETPEWFCWAAFQRLMARRCGEVWLESVAPALAPSAEALARRASANYGEAFQCYRAYLEELRESGPDQVSLRDRARSPERIRALAPLLARGIEAEESALDCLEELVERLE